MRNILDVADDIIKVIDEECDFNEEKIIDIIEQIEKVKKGSLYKAPELVYTSWNELASILNENFNADNSSWEKKIQTIFNGRSDEK